MSPAAKNKLFLIVFFFYKICPLAAACRNLLVLQDLMWELHRLVPVKQGAAEKGFRGRVAELKDSSCMEAAVLPAPYWFSVLQG